MVLGPSATAKSPGFVRDTKIKTFDLVDVAAGGDASGSGASSDTGAVSSTAGGGF